MLLINEIFIADPCTSDADCALANQTCDVSTGVCTCSIGFGPFGVNGECKELPGRFVCLFVSGVISKGLGQLFI